MCFASDEEEDDETIEIVSDPVAAMGKTQSSVARKNSSVGMSTGNMTNNSDPYAQTQNVVVHLGDPYAKSLATPPAVTGDPYATIGTVSTIQPQKTVAKKASALNKKPAELPTSTKAVAKKKSKTSTPFVPREQHSLTAALFKSLQGGGAFASEAQAAVQAIDEEVKNRENQLKLVAEEHFVSMKREINEQASQLRREADAAALALKTKTEDRVQSLLETAESRMARLNQEVTQEAVKLKQEAAQKALFVMDEMEKRASERRIQERKRTLASAFGLSENALTQEETIPQVKKPNAAAKKQRTTTTASHKQPTSEKNKTPDTTTASNVVMRVSAEWKNDLSRRFYQDMTTMKEIIIAAESPVEAQDFLKKFEEQNKWFDLTLRSTRSITDDQYTQLANKQAQMSRLMQSQHIADDYLQKFTKNMALDTAQLKKIRLSVLYELNTRTQQRASHLDTSIRESGLPDDEIKSLVKRTLSEFSQQFRDIAAQFPDVELGGANRKPQLSLVAVPLAAQQLEADLKEAKALAETTKQELDATQQQLVVAQESITQTKTALEQEKAEKEALNLAKEQVILEKNGIKATALDLVSTQIRSNVDTELSLAGSQQDNKLLKSELVDSAAKNSLLQNQKRVLVGAVEEARKDAFNEALLRGEDVRRAQKTVTVVQRQAKEHIKALTESSSKRELSLSADLRQAHEKIGVLSSKQAKLMRDLEVQQETSKMLKKSLLAAQEQAGKSESRADLANRSLAENTMIVQRNIVLRKQAEARAKITEELAQQTIDSINGFLRTERKVLGTEREKLALQEKEVAKKTIALEAQVENLASQEDFLDGYRDQLAKDRNMLENLKRETRKIVENSAELSESLNDDFIRMQEQIENDLRVAQQETRRELAVAQKRVNDLQPSSKPAMAKAAMPQLATAVEDHDVAIIESPMPRQQAMPVMPGAKPPTTKQAAARMPGLSA